LDHQEPTEWLEARRLEYIHRLEQNADWARQDGDRDGELKALAFLTRLTSVYRQRIDVKTSHLGLIKAPDLSRLSAQELEMMERDDDQMLSVVAEKIMERKEEAK